MSNVKQFWKAFKNRKAMVPYVGKRRSLDPHKMVHETIPKMMKTRIAKSTVSGAAIGGIGGASIPASMEGGKGKTWKERRELARKLKGKQKALTKEYKAKSFLGRIKGSAKYQKSMNKLTTSGQKRLGMGIAGASIGAQVGLIGGAASSSRAAKQMGEKISPYIQHAMDPKTMKTTFKMHSDVVSGSNTGTLSKLVNKFRSQKVSAKEFANKFHPDKNKNIDPDIKKNFGNIYHELKSKGESFSNKAHRAFEEAEAVAHKEKKRWKPWDKNPVADYKSLKEMGAAAEAARYREQAQKARRR